MKKKKTKLLFSLIAVVLCMAAFSVTAFASGDDWCEYGDYGTPDAAASEPVDVTETSEPTPTPSPVPSAKPSTGTAGGGTTAAVTQPETGTTPEKEDDPSGDGEIGSGKPLTPSGNLNLVDDVLQVNDSGTDSKDTAGAAKPSSGNNGPEEKQFITVQSKNGNYFYIVIDRSGDTENVHFLNQVDEADLLALMEGDSAEEKPPVCTCTDKCMAGDINLSCPVCQTTMSECTGREPEPEPSPEPDTELEKPETKSGNSGLLLIVLVLAMVGGGALYYFKLRKPKTDTKGPVDLDDYDFGEDDEDYEFEPDDADEPDEQNEGD